MLSARRDGVAFLNGVGRTTIVRAAYNMAEAVVWLHEQCTRVRGSAADM